MNQQQKENRNEKKPERTVEDALVGRYVDEEAGELLLAPLGPSQVFDVVDGPQLQLRRPHVGVVQVVQIIGADLSDDVNETEFLLDIFPDCQIVGLG